ncbi:hypothetical protein C0Q70_18419 [Pomacea canaliculata]|uniref:Uncharacterized protein n=1 Tax=Pomacea canaliculata TaxID=400727 RepID=A0A2T7NN48_POMCA|nr:hypothetical protein C0Q70_18419 [Pomacea canaliculata]
MNILVNGGHQNLTLTLKEKFELNFYFVDGLKDAQNITVYVQHRLPGSTVFNSKCILKYSRENCTSTTTLCRCMGPPLANYSLSKVFTQEDAGTWVVTLWKAQNQVKETIDIFVEARRLVGIRKERRVGFDHTASDCISFLPKKQTGTECRTWQLYTDSQNISVESGVESNIDFFLSDYRHLEKDIRIIVQRRGSNKIYETKCQLNHSATRCTREYGPCECVGERSESYQYRLKMNFSEQDGGLGTLLLTIFNYSQTAVNVQNSERANRNAFRRPASTMRYSDHNATDSKDIDSSFSTSRTKHILVNGGRQNLTLKFNESFNLQFSFPDPMEDDEGIILVQHRPLYAAVFGRRCVIVRSPKNCSSSMELCRCLGPPFGMYSLRKVVTKEDYGTWLINLWKAHHEREETLYITVEDCRMWKMQTDSHDITVENGVESNIDFFLTDYRSLNIVACGN